MLMKKMHFWIALIIMHSFLGIAFAGAKQDATCSPELKNQFKKLYIELQQKLNYGGKDAKLVGNILKLEEHAKGKEYEGQVFEKILYTEYQNSLKKVAKILQDKDGKIKNATTDLSKDFPEVVNFFKAIEESESGKESDKLKNINMTNLLSQMQKLGNDKLKDEKDKKFLLTENDLYLLRKLMIHAQDYTMRVDEYEKKVAAKKPANSKKDLAAKEKSEIPLKTLLLALKDGKISQDTNLDITETDNIIKDAINKQMALLKDFLNKHPECLNFIKNNPNFIQAGIQSTNFKKFIDVLNCTNDKPLNPLPEHDIQNMEALLQFISANQKHGNIEAKAETGFNPKELLKFNKNAFNAPAAVTPAAVTPAAVTPAAVTPAAVTPAAVTRKADDDLPMQCEKAANSDGSIKVSKLDLNDFKKPINATDFICNFKDKQVPGDECVKNLDFDQEKGLVSINKEYKDKKENPPFTLTITDCPTCKDISFTPTKKLMICSAASSDGSIPVEHLDLDDNGLPKNKDLFECTKGTSTFKGSQCTDLLTFDKNKNTISIKRVTAATNPQAPILSTNPASQTATGTASQTATGTASQTAPGTASQTAPGTASQTAPGTASQTAPGTASQTAPGAASQTAPGAVSQTAPGAVSQTAPIAASITQTPSTATTTEPLKLSIAGCETCQGITVPASQAAKPESAPQAAKPESAPEAPKKASCKTEADGSISLTDFKLKEGESDQFTCSVDKKELASADCLKLVDIKDGKISRKDKDKDKLESFSVKGANDNCQNLWKAKPATETPAEDKCKVDPNSKECCDQKNEDAIKPKEESSSTDETVPEVLLKKIIKWEFKNGKCIEKKDKKDNSTPDGGAPLGPETPANKGSLPPRTPAIQMPSFQMIPTSGWF